MSIRELRPFRSRVRLAAEAESLHGSITDHLSDMISAHAPDGTYRYVSVAAKEILGYEPDDLIGEPAFAFIHPDDKNKAEVAHRSSLNGASLTLAYRLRRKDNEYVWVETTSRMIASEETGEPREIVCSTRPLSDRHALTHLTSDEHRASLDRIQEVLDNELLDLVYQPIFELDSDRVIAFEALSRFPGDPARGPDRWFAEAWDVGLGVPLELLAVQVAGRALHEIPTGVGLTVNASPPTVFADGFMSCFGQDAGRITVELTEHLHVDDYEGFSARLGPLRTAGGTVAIDDFGAGYASLRHILKVRPEWIKLDISLTERIDENSVAHALANSLITFAQQVGVEVIAEGIETEDELDALLEIGFKYGQGFYFGMPAPLDEALARLS
jgi:PAS domain S-box-containing protein